MRTQQKVHQLVLREKQRGIRLSASSLWRGTDTVFQRVSPRLKLEAAVGDDSTFDDSMNDDLMGARIL